MKTAVSYLKSDDYSKCIGLIDISSADYIHVDMCDGLYVRNKNFEIEDLLKLLNIAKKPLNIHMMCKEPIEYLDKLFTLNVESITIHPLACSDVVGTLKYIKEHNIKCGVALNPNEKLSLIDKYFAIVDEILIMSVHPGKGGQEFIPKVLYKIDELNKIKNNYNFIIAIDGGINDQTIKQLVGKNVDLVISGSFITNSNNYNEALEKLNV